MRERKDMGELPKAELVPPSRTGKRATVVMKVEVMVEVYESDDWNDMVEQAKDQLNKRVIEAKGFYPYYAKARTIYTDVEVEDLKKRTYVEAKGRW
jgi:hypothetical protein